MPIRHFEAIKSGSFGLDEILNWARAHQLDPNSIRLELLPDRELYFYGERPDVPPQEGPTPTDDREIGFHVDMVLSLQDDREPRATAHVCAHVNFSRLAMMALMSERGPRLFSRYLMKHMNDYDGHFFADETGLKVVLQRAFEQLGLKKGE